LNTRQVLESMEPIIREELGHHSDRDLDRVRRWLEKSLERHAFLSHVAAAAEEAARNFGLPVGYPRTDLREDVYCALDGIKAKGDLEHRHLVDRLDDSGLLAPTLRLAEIACDHYDGEPLDRDAIREDLESVRRERSERHLRLAGPST
jgi:hypothetical protein